MDMMTMVQRLTAVYGISGREATVAEEIRRMAEPYADEIWTDRLGNLICHKRERASKVMFAAHLDSIGLIVTHIEALAFSGSAKIGASGRKRSFTPWSRGFEKQELRHHRLQRTDLGKLSHGGSLCGYRCGEPGKRGGEKGVCGRCCRLYGAS